LQRHLECDRTARRVGAGGVRRRRPAARRPDRGTCERRGDPPVARRADRGGAPLGAATSGRVLVSDSEALLAVASEAARMAGALLQERARHGAEEVTSKSTPTDLVSQADIASERAIRELLAARRPEDGFVAEEGGS